LIRLAKPWIGEDERRAVAAVLESGQLVQGALVERFEQAVAALIGRRHAIAVSSGTAALQLVLKALQIGPGDEVLCPALSWPSPAHAVRIAGAKVRFVDVDQNEWNSSAEALREARNGSMRQPREGVVSELSPAEDPDDG
jgi:dTDP-4-amino-4,6-dideoxygalactose transaminase